MSTYRSLCKPLMSLQRVKFVLSKTFSKLHPFSITEILSLCNRMFSVPFDFLKKGLCHTIPLVTSFFFFWHIYNKSVLFFQHTLFDLENAIIFQYLSFSTANFYSNIQKSRFGIWICRFHFKKKLKIQRILVFFVKLVYRRIIYNIIIVMLILIKEYIKGFGQFHLKNISDVYESLL